MPDKITLVENSLNKIAKVIIGVIQQLQLMDETAKIFGRKSALLNQNPIESNLRNKQLRIAEQFATELKKRSPQINELATELQESCTNLDAGFERYPSLNDVEDSLELERVQNSITILKDSKDDLIGTTEELENIRDMTDRFRKFLLQSVGENEEIDSPLCKATASLSNLIDQLRHFETLSTAIVNRFP